MDYLASFIELLAKRSNNKEITGETELRIDT